MPKEKCVIHNKLKPAGKEVGIKSSHGNEVENPGAGKGTVRCI
jgi:hypothetical protein